MAALMLALATRGCYPGSPRWTAMLWTAWGLAFCAAVASLMVSAQQWREALDASAAVAPLAVPAAISAARVPTPTDDVLPRLLSDAPNRPTALHALHQALQAAHGVQLMSVEVSTQSSAIDRLDRTNVTMQLRGPYAEVKQVLAGWIARFELSSLISLRVGRATAPGVVEATASAALWTRPAMPSAPEASATAAAAR